MTGHFEFDQQRTHGTNRVSDAPCPTCDGHRLVPVDANDPETAYRRCDQCNAAPVKEREPVRADGWWKQ